MRFSGCIAILILFSAGCGGEEAKAPTPGKKAEQPAAPAGPATPVPAESVQTASAVTAAAKSEANFNYDPEARRDPFRSILVTAEGARKLDSLPPLLRTEIRDMLLIGVVWGAFGYSAMVQMPDGKGYTVRTGTEIGTNNGIVKKITQDRVLVEEKFQDIFGESKVREVALELHQNKEGSE